MSLRLPPIPQALLWAISVLALLVWLGVGWLWWGQRVRTGQIEFPPAFLTGYPTPSWLAQWTDYRDNIVGFNFEHPNLFQINSYANELGGVGWVLQNSSSYPLLEIILTDWSLAQIKERYSRLEFTPYTTTYFSGYYASYTSDKEDSRFFYLEAETNKALWVTGRLDQLTVQFPTLSYQEKENILQRVVKTIRIDHE